MSYIDDEDIMTCPLCGGVINEEDEEPHVCPDPVEPGEGSQSDDSIEDYDDDE